MLSALLAPFAPVVFKPDCHVGSAKKLLTPPPPAPPSEPSFQTDFTGNSGLTRFQARATTGERIRTRRREVDVIRPSVTPSLEPLSPEATQIVTPSVAAA